MPSQDVPFGWIVTTSLVRKMSRTSSTSSTLSALTSTMPLHKSCVGRAVEIDESTINTLLRVETTAGEELILPISEELIERLELQGHRLYLHIPHRTT